MMIGNNNFGTNWIGLELIFKKIEMIGNDWKSQFCIKKKLGVL